MKILFISHIYPWPLDNGTCQRIYRLAEGLANRHELTFLAPNPIDDLSRDNSDLNCPLRNVCKDYYLIPMPLIRKSVAYWAPASERLLSLFSSSLPNFVSNNKWPQLTTALLNLRQENSYDAVWVERHHLAESAHEAGFRRFVIDIDTIETVSLARKLKQAAWYLSKPLHYAEMTKVFLYERSLGSHGNRLVVCKESDRHFWGRNNRNVFVVPNGVSNEQPAAPERELSDELLFVGTLNYEPNIEAIHFFMNQVWPMLSACRPNLCFRIIGRSPTPSVLALHDGCRIFVTGNVDDLTPYYDSATAVVAPIHGGGGTRLKVLEALVKAKALIATSVAAEGLDLRPGIDLEIADTPDCFASACMRVLLDVDHRRRLGSNGRQTVLDKYLWDKCVDEAEAVLVSLTNIVQTHDN